MFDIVAGTAGIIGLGLTIWTLIVAKQARQAAREARQAVSMDNAAEEFKNIAIIANEFLGHVETDQAGGPDNGTDSTLEGGPSKLRLGGDFLSAERMRTVGKMPTCRGQELQLAGLVEEPDPKSQGD
jgi:hypothetical protein